MQDPLNAPALLRSYGIRPKKKLGQNFIVKQSALNRILMAASLGEQTTQIVEIGAGLGALTLALAKRQHDILAIEYDQRLIPVLHDVLGSYDNVKIIHGDFLQLNLEDVIAPPEYHVVANIPYQITSAVIRKIVESRYPARRVVLTIQREVAERIIAQPGRLSLLALSVQVFGQPNIVAHIPPEAFYPRPGVESSVIRIDMFPQPSIPVADLDHFFRIAKAGFSQKRKKLRNALSAGLQILPSEVETIMRSVQLSPAKRAQELSVNQWRELSTAFLERI